MPSSSLSIEVSSLAVFMKIMTIGPRIFFLSLFIVLVCEAIALSVIYNASYSPLPVLGVERIVETGLLLLAVSVRGRGLPAIGLRKGETLAGLKRGFIWSAFFGLAALVFFSILAAVRISPFEIIQATFPSNPKELVLFFLVGALIAPVAEEVFFRGIVYGFFRRWGVVLAVLGTSFIFVAAHAVRAGVPLPQIVGGIVFAVAYEVEGNLMVPITVHVMGNAAIFSFCLLGAAIWPV